LKAGVSGADVYQARGLARSKVKQHAGAVADYTRALELEVTPSALLARGWIYLLVYDAPRLALPDFEEALRLAPDSADGYNGRGYALVLLGRPEQGVANALEALKLGPADSRHCYNAARIYSRAVGQFGEGRSDPESRDQCREWQERAVQLLRRSLSLRPTAGRSSFWRECVLADSAFKPLQRSAAFAQLAAEYSH
jgi:tetratricopeptide (TPR) repeat protein